MRKEVNGVPLNYQLHQAGAGRPWLVLIHSLGLDSSAWRWQIEPLSRDFNLITYDVRGAGRSSWLPLNSSPADTSSGDGKLSFDLLAADLFGLLQHLGRDQDVTLLGWAMGGMVAMAYASHHPLRALVLSNSTAYYPPAITEVLNKRADEILAGGDRWQAALSAQVNRWVSEAGGQRNPGLVEFARESLERQDPPALAALMRITGGVELRDRLPQIAYATLVIAGDEDVAVPTAMAHEVAAGIAGAEFATITQAGHLAPLEQPGQWNRVVGEFLGQKL